MKIDIVLHIDGFIGLLRVIFYIYLLIISPQHKTQKFKKGVLAVHGAGDKVST